MATVLRSSVAEPSRVCAVSYASQPCVVLACDGHNDTWPQETDESNIHELDGRLYSFESSAVTCAACLSKRTEGGV